MSLIEQSLIRLNAAINALDSAIENQSHAVSAQENAGSIDLRATRPGQSKAYDADGDGQTDMFGGLDKDQAAIVAEKLDNAIKQVEDILEDA